MRVDFTTIWIFRVWIPHLIIALYVEVALAVPTCKDNEYLKDKKCCKKCEPGTYAFQLCTSTTVTKCRPCGSKEYQPDWNTESKCLHQKFCDNVKGFMPDSAENHTAPVPCVCRPGTHCSLINCEYCEEIRKCAAGYGLTMDEESRRGKCDPCEHGYFSSGLSTEPCRPWTNCKAHGKTEKQPGSDKSDSVCGPLITGISPLWVVVAVLSSLVTLSLVILFLFCYMETFTPFSENLRTCVQSLKRTRIQQEASCITSNGPQSCTLLYEEECRDPANSSPNNRVAQEDLGATGGEEKGSGTGTPRELSEKEPPLTSGSCSCELSVRGPLEVGENEDCSQAVATGPCSCGADTDTTRGPPPSEDRSPNPAGHLGLCDLLLDLSSRAGREAPSNREAGLSGDVPAAGDSREKEPCCCSIDSTVAPLLSMNCNEELSSEEKLPSDEPPQDPGLDLSGQNSDTHVASGNVSGNKNTTFISNGQVMNFSGDVIVVYVNQGSQSGDEAQDDAFGSPVQEESSVEGGQGPAKAEAIRAPWENTSHVQRERPTEQPAGTQRILPVQEERNGWHQQKLL